MAGPGARSAEGLGAWMHPTIPGHRSLSARSAPEGAFRVLAERKGCRGRAGSTDSPGSESGQPNGWPCSAQRGRVGCMDAPNTPRPPIPISAKRPGRGVLRIWRERRGCRRPLTMLRPLERAPTITPYAAAEARPRRVTPGDCPMTRLYARLKAACDAYPRRSATISMDRLCWVSH